LVSAFAIVVGGLLQSRQHVLEVTVPPEQAPKLVIDLIAAEKILEDFGREHAAPIVAEARAGQQDVGHGEKSLFRLNRMIAGVCGSMRSSLGMRSNINTKNIDRNLDRIFELRKVTFDFFKC
jgi:hypothetical protein